ncbi:MAG TPA: CPBP family glutamic-type intramembrane protease [Actinomycetes bacterium]|jgi:membrane protease YdiL (CAAX protease family)|nr:CPBP family glutamic-type intramembrane protease [Actinomycetes bacterium]
MPLRNLGRRFPLAAYFGLVYAVSVAALAVVGLPRPAAGGDRQAQVALVLFPVMVVAVGAVGVVLTAATGGRDGVAALLWRMRRWRVGARWYAALLIPPAGILAVLLALRMVVSRAFTPNLFPVGLTFGLVAGWFEEVGWTGYAYPRMRARLGALAAAVLLGVLWGVWHLPVVDSLGAAHPHGRFWIPFFLAFVAVLAAIRVLIAWLYTNTSSVLLAQLMHASSTGCLVMLGAAHVSAAQEALWYAVYAGVLWTGVAAVATASGTRLARTVEVAGPT